MDISNEEGMSWLVAVRDTEGYNLIAVYGPYDDEAQAKTLAEKFNELETSQTWSTYSKEGEQQPDSDFEMYFVAEPLRVFRRTPENIVNDFELDEPPETYAIEREAS